MTELNKLTTSEQFNLQFTIDQKTAFELIEGSNIYNTRLTFIRELLQNAMDATKLQMWKDIRSGKYDNREDIGCVNRALSKERPKFYDEIPEKIKDFYPISMNFYLDDSNSNGQDSIDKEAHYIFTIEDKGCGITMEDLKRMGKVGESWIKDEDLSSFIQDMPFFLQPTGNFGLGLHSVFMVTDEIYMETKSEKNTAYDITFATRRKSGLITIKENKEKTTVGTKITVKIKESMLDFITPDLHLINKKTRYDFLDSNYHQNRVFDHFREYIRIFTRNIYMLQVNCSIDNVPINISGDYSFTLNTNNISPLIKTYSDHGLTYNIYINEDSIIEAYVKDNILGATLTLTPSITPLVLSFDEGHGNLSFTSYESSSCDISYKEISCNSNINTSFIDVSLNLFKDRAKDILDVSRNYIKDDLLRKIEERIKRVIIPNFLMAVTEFLNIYEIKNLLETENDNVALKTSIIVYNLLSFAHLNQSKVEPSTFDGNIVIPNLRKKDLSSGSFINGTLNDFMSSSNIYLTYFKYNFDSFNHISDEDAHNTYALVYEDYSIMAEFLEKFLLDEYFFTPSSFSFPRYIARLKRQSFNNLEPYCVNIKNDNYLRHKVLSLLDSKSTYRNFIPTIKYSETESPYECLAVNYIPHWGNALECTNYAKYSIVSPISKPLPKDLIHDSNGLKAWIKTNCNFDKLVDWVYENSVIQPNDKEAIKNAYMALIDDFVDVMKAQ